MDQVERFGTYLSGETESPFPTLERGNEQAESPEVVDKRLLRAPWDRLSRLAAAPDLVARLRRPLEHAPDLDVLKMRPLRLADAWQMDRLDVLSLFLHATQAGIVVMHWDVLCPHCLTAKASTASLAHLEPNAFCASCATAYERAATACASSSASGQCDGDSDGTTPRRYVSSESELTAKT